MNNIEKILTPIDSSTFFATIWEKKWFHIPRIDAQYFHEILTIEDVDDMLQSKIIPQKLIRISNAKQNVNHFKGETQSPQLFSDWQNVLDNETLFTQFAKEETSLILHHAQDYFPKISVFVSHLEKALGFNVNANIYITPPNSQAFKTHFDSHDTFIMHIFGDKQWHIYDSAVDLPDDKFKSMGVSPNINWSKYAKDDCPNVFNVSVGDTLYVPRGWAHRVVSTSSPSVHITLGLYPKKKFNLIETIADNALLDKENTFRKAFPHHLPEEGKLEFIDKFKEELIAFIQKMPNEQILNRLENKFVNNKSINFRGRFKDILLQSQLSESSILTIKQDIEYRLKQKGMQLSLRFNGKKLPLPFFLKGLFDFMETNEQFTTSDLPSKFSIAEKLKIMQLLVKEGFLAIVEL